MSEPHHPATNTNQPVAAVSDHPSAAAIVVDQGNIVCLLYLLFAVSLLHDVVLLC